MRLNSATDRATRVPVIRVPAPLRGLVVSARLRLAPLPCCHLDSTALTDNPWYHCVVRGERSELDRGWTINPRAGGCLR